MKRLAHLFVLVCVGLISLNAQTKKINGLVKIYNENSPVSDVKIKIKGTNYITNTNKKGNFELEVPDTISNITFAKIRGYNFKDVKNNGESWYELSLVSLNTKEIYELSFEEIMNYKLETAAKKKEQAAEIPASIVVIDRKEIETYGYNSLEEILSQVTGLYLWDDYHVRGRINIGLRGYMSSDNVIIMVNGVNQVENVYNEYLLPKIGVPVEAIDKIEIVRGPMSVVYGSGAFFGVINIITNDVKYSSANIVSTTYGSNNTSRGTLKITGKKKDFKVAFTASAYHTDGPTWKYSDMMSTPSNLLNWGLTTDATTEKILKENRAYFNFNGEYKSLNVDFTHSMVDRGGFLVQPPVDFSPMRRNSTNVLARYKQSLTKKVWLEGKASYLSTNSLAFYFLNEPDSYLSFGYNSDAVELEFLANFNFSKNIEMISGLLHQNTFYATNPAELEAVWGIPFGHHLTRLGIDSRIMVNSAFLQGDFELSERIKFVVGLRVQQMMKYKMESTGGAPLVSDGREIYRDEYENDNVHFIPRIAALYSISNYHIVKLLYGKAFRHPPLGKLADMLFYTYDGAEFKAPQLISSKIETYEVNYTGSFGENFSVNLSFFRNNMYDLLSQYIFQDPAGETALYYTSNVGKILTHGCEARFVVNLFDKFRLDLSGMYQQSDNKTLHYEDIPVPYSPEFVGYLKSSYHFTNNTTFSLTGNYTTSMYAEYDKLNEVSIGQETDDFFQLNANLKFSNLFTYGLNLDIKCNNLFDQEVHYPATTLNTFADKGLYGLGRTFYATISYHF